MEEIIKCPVSGTPLNEKCEKSCNTCGWNPAVVARRKAAIREYAEQGALHVWGYEPPANATPSIIAGELEVRLEQLRRAEREAERLT